MSAIALKRNYQLEMPNSYVGVERDEMEYVNGGGDWVRTEYGCNMNVFADEVAGEILSWQEQKRKITFWGDKVSVLLWGLRLVVSASESEMDYVINHLGYAQSCGVGATICYSGTFYVNVWN